LSDHGGNYLSRDRWLSCFSPTNMYVSRKSLISRIFSKNLEIWIMETLKNGFKVASMSCDLVYDWHAGAAREQVQGRRMGRVKMMKTEPMIMLLMHSSTVHWEFAIPHRSVGSWIHWYHCHKEYLKDHV
jgi:hypothetical protein